MLVTFPVSVLLWQQQQKGFRLTVQNASIPLKGKLKSTSESLWEKPLSVCGQPKQDFLQDLTLRFPGINLWKKFLNEILPHGTLLHCNSIYHSEYEKPNSVSSYTLTEAQATGKFQEQSGPKITFSKKGIGLFINSWFVVNQIDPTSCPLSFWGMEVHSLVIKSLGEVLCECP